MRTFEEIYAEIVAAVHTSDNAALHRLAEEMQALGTPQAAASASRALGTAFRITGDYTQALEHYRQALHGFEDLRDRTSAASVTGSIGTLYWNTGDFMQALEYFQRALLVHEELGNRSEAASQLHSIGNVYFSTGDYPKALDLYQQALQVHSELGEHDDMARITANIGGVYGNYGDYTKALEYFQRALQMHENSGNRESAAIVIGNIAIVYTSTGDVPQGLEYYQRALRMLDGIGSAVGAAGIMSGMADALMMLNRDEEAVELLQRQSAMAIDDPLIRAENLVGRARLAERADGVDSAWEYLQQALKIVTKAGMRESAATYHRMLRDLAKKRNDFEGYVTHNEEYQRITDEIKGTHATQRLTMVEAERKMEAERREREKEQALLYGALPESVANRMLRGESVSGDHVEQATVIFLDIVRFTELADRIPPGHVVHLLEQIFSTLDDVCAKHGATKIKTIGDSYMAVVGVPEPLDDHAIRAARIAVEMMSALDALELTMPSEMGDTSWINNVGDITVRIGMHCGPVTAGVIGKQRLQYDVWGDTVNVASRMESTGEPGRIHVSEAFAHALTPCLSDSLTLFQRGEISIKGKGPMTTYWLKSTLP